MSIIVFSWEGLLPPYHMRGGGGENRLFFFSVFSLFFVNFSFWFAFCSRELLRCILFYWDLCVCLCVRTRVCASKFIQTHCILDDLPNGHQFTWPLWRPKPRNGKAICRNKMSSNNTIDGIVNGWKWDKTINPNSQRKWKKMSTKMK